MKKIFNKQVVCFVAGIGCGMGIMGVLLNMCN